MILLPLCTFLHMVPEQLFKLFFKVSKCQFKKAMLKNYLNQEKEEENDSAVESEQQVGSAQNEPENPVSDVSLLEEESPSLPISLSFYWEILGNTP